MAVSDWDKKYLSADQQASIQKATDYGSQTGDWATAHAMAESIRASAGYSGGGNGTQYVALQKESAPTYDLTGYLRERQQAKMAAQQAALKGSYDNSLSGYNAGLEALPQTYDAVRNKAAAQSALSRRSFNEQAAAAGLNTGTSGQAALARSSVLQSNLAGADREQANAVSEIELAKAQLRQQYEAAIAAAAAEGEAELANALYQEMVRVQELQRENERYDQQWQYQLERDAIEDARYEDETAYERALAAMARAGASGAGTQAQDATQPQAVERPQPETLYVYGLGDVTYTQAERLEEQGAIRLTGLDKNGNPLYVAVPEAQRSAGRNSVVDFGW